MKAPFRFVFKHPEMLKLVSSILLNATFKHKAKGGLPPIGESVSDKLKPIDPEILACYNNWIGRKDDGMVPPHLLAAICIPTASKLSSKLPYPLHKILNQGMKMTIHAPLKKEFPYNITATLNGVEEQEYRIRIHQKLEFATDNNTPFLTADFFAIIPKKRPPKSQKEVFQLPKKANLIDSWEIEKDAGAQFARITGDFNPIHWSAMAAKLSGFKTNIIHGFGMLAKTYQTLEEAAYSIKEIDIRYLRPLTMPNKVQVYVLKREHDYELFLVDNSKTFIHMGGSFRL